jgi:hypothetical protein
MTFVLAFIRLIWRFAHWSNPLALTLVRTGRVTGYMFAGRYFEGTMRCAPPAANDNILNRVAYDRPIVHFRQLKGTAQT